MLNQFQIKALFFLKLYIESFYRVTGFGNFCYNFKKKITYP